VVFLARKWRRCRDAGIFNFAGEADEWCLLIEFCSGSWGCWSSMKEEAGRPRKARRMLVPAGATSRLFARLLVIAALEIGRWSRFSLPRWT